LSTGDIMAYVLYMNIIIWPTRMLVELYGMSIRAMAAAERIFEIIDMPALITDPPHPVPIRTMRGEIALEQAGFRYDENGTWIVRGLDVQIRAGETVALVGETGAGKTTIASLMARFYDVQEGCVRIDGVDIRQYGLRDLHARMGIVLQQGYLFSGTVMDNLRFRCHAMSDDEVIRQAKALGTHDVVMALADGYHTRVHEGGASLSLGQRQVVAITRALLADPAILILDEPTSALDIHTEAIIQQAIERLIRNRTTILIAHARIERFENPETDSYDRYVPRLHRLASQVLQEWCDEVMFATFKVFTKQTAEGFDRKRNQGIGTGERVLRTVERPAHVAKNRLSLPEELPLDWNVYAQHISPEPVSAPQGGKSKGAK